jgi:hypothetical protein
MGALDLYLADVRANAAVASRIREAQLAEERRRLERYYTDSVMVGGWDVGGWDLDRWAA